jgi:hypothetical protein
MLRTHRIKKVNLSAVSDVLTNQNIPFQIVDAPLSWTASCIIDGWYDVDYEHAVMLNDLDGMVGLQCDLSGKKFRKLLVGIGVVNK